MLVGLETNLGLQSKVQEIDQLDYALDITPTRLVVKLISIKIS
jgi:hypothetical protein